MADDYAAWRLASWLRAALVATELSGHDRLARGAHAVTAEPEVVEVTGGGIPATLVLPAGGRQRPALVFLNGVTARGRAHPLVQRLAAALGRSGIAALVPDPPGLATGELTEATVDGVVGATRWLCGRQDVAEERAALAGVSLGTTLALLAAQRPELAPHVSCIAGIASFTSLPHTIRAGTTGCFVDRGRPFAYPSSSFLSLVVGRSVIANLTSTDDREHLRPLLLAVADDDPDPLAPLRAVDSRTLGDEARTALELLLNRDPDRFDDLYAALPTAFQAKVTALSPIERAQMLAGIPIELVSAPRDAYFPLCESQALLDVLPRCRLTVTTALAHAVPITTVGGLRGIHSFACFLARTLELVAHSPERPRS
jgi:pimeloyl-ACP methyl ester carboxylesterase